MELFDKYHRNMEYFGQRFKVIKDWHTLFCLSFAPLFLSVFAWCAQALQTLFCLLISNICILSILKLAFAISYIANVFLWLIILVTRIKEFILLSQGVCGIRKGMMVFDTKIGSVELGSNSNWGCLNSFCKCLCLFFPAVFVKIAE